MLRVVIFGVGKSSSYLIKKLQDISSTISLHITLADKNWNQLPENCKNHKDTTYKLVDINNSDETKNLIVSQNLVISMLPAHLHINIAKLCLKNKKELLTASYISEEMQQLDTQARENGLLFLNEMGVDPGLDHMSAMSIIDTLKTKEATINSFYSHTGGLISKYTPNNWNYKFTWNPKNVITAGSDGAVFLKNSEKKHLDYNEIFSEIIPVKINNKIYDSYANRNSLKYIKKYNLEGINNLYRGTLRHHNYCYAWNVFVQLGMTNDVHLLTFNEDATRKDFITYFFNTNILTETSFCKKNNITKENSLFKKFDLLGFFNNDKTLTINKGTAADILLSILLEEWKMEKNDKDILLMQHQINYSIDGINYKTKSEISILGEDNQYTAMAKTVGAPMFETALLMLHNKIELTGVHIPTTPVIYRPVLDKLKKHGLNFIETTTQY